MKIPRIFMLVGFAITLFAVIAGGWFYYQERQREAEQAAFKVELDIKKRNASYQMAAERVRVAQQLARITGMIPAEKNRPFSDYVINYLTPAAYPKPASEWKTTEKAFYQKLLPSGQFDLLVVPFQVQEYALDRRTRSLMTAEVALYLAQAKNIKIPDPYLVARALGDGDRRLDNNEAYALAQKLGVKKIVWGYVGHDRKNHMGITLQTQECPGNGMITTQTTTKNFENIEFSDELPPIEAFQASLPEILKTLGAESPTLTLSEEKTKVSELPEQPFDLTKESDNPAQTALNFQLLAYLTPRVTERSKERFIEKSYLALLRLSPKAEEYRELKARALMLLGLRPAALKVLGEPQTNEEKGLFAALNGNLPDAGKYSGQIKPAIKKLIAKLDEYEINYEYTYIGKKESASFAKGIRLPGKFWQYTVNRALTERDDWTQFENLPTKAMLDILFPIKDYSAESLMRGAITLGDTEKMESLSQLSPINHIHKLLELEPAKWCCQASVDHLTNNDFLDLLEAIGEDNLLRRASFYTTTQGSPERALDYLKGIETTYKGQPRFTLELAKAQSKKADALEGAEKEALKKSAYTNNFNAYYWEQGQTLMTADAINLYSEIQRQDYGIFENFFASDYPYRSFYPAWESGGIPEKMEPNSLAAIKNSTSNLESFSYLNWLYNDVKHDEAKYSALLKSLEGRFVGEPAIYQYMAKNSLANGDIGSAERYYREGIKAQPNVWQPYMDLGNLLFEQGKTKEAYKLFMDYPGFKKNSNENPVHISNYAYEPGSKFYWLGEFSLAKPLYEIASRKPTGSEADIASRLRLKLMEGDLHSALIGSLERARRYNDTYGYRDYLGLLHAMGESKAAWDAFHALTNQAGSSHIWETVLVGHRKEKKSEAEIIEWVKDEVKQNIGKNNNHAAKYLFRYGVVDRKPSMMFSKAIAEVAQPVWKTDYRGYVVELSANGSEEVVLGPNINSKEGSTLPNGVFEFSKKHQVKSYLVYFAEAYQMIKLGNLSAAKSLLEEASTLYDLSQNNLGSLLPYYAYAAAKSGDISKVEKYLAEFGTENKRFDYHLAEAVLSGISGKTEEAVQNLKTALYKRPYTEERALQTEHQYADICKLLFEATGKAEYKKIALDWAKKNQVFQPWFSWAYAMEAIYTDNKNERKKAIAMADYLDPQSEMLKQIPEKEREFAIKQYKPLNPFIKRENHKTESAI